MQHATVTYYQHTIPPVRKGIQRGWQARKTTHLVHSDLLEHATVRKSWCESTGRCTGCEFTRGWERPYTSPTSKAVLATKLLHFLSLPENIVVYSNAFHSVDSMKIPIFLRARAQLVVRKRGKGRYFSLSSTIVIQN